MKLTISTIVLLLLCCFTGYAQTNYAIKGISADTTEKVKLANTTIMVLNAKDSILQKFTRAKADGSFALSSLSAGPKIVVLSYPGYADYTETILLNAEKPVHDFGSVGMTLKSKLLADILIKGKVDAIKIKGDTTEFNAKAYAIQPNSKVEDLIKQFPGIQVDKDGKITAQGATVTKVLLDGEEFFGDDPTLVTKNIRADMVDKVQLYDKKSDQATFTGIDDGKTDKTLNIKLKEGKKKGYFGKVDAGMGTDKFYTGQLLYNKFQDKQKFSIYGIGANTGKTGLNWDDNQKYADGNNVEYMDGGGIMFFGGGGNDLYYNGDGLPKALTGGMHYDNKWGANDKYSLNTNYKIGRLEIDGTRQTRTQTTLADGSVLNSVSNQINNNSTFRQKLDFTYKVTIDTTANIKIAVDGSLRNRKSYTMASDTSWRGDGTLLNTNNSDITSDVESRNFNASAFYTKKLKKKGRTISALLGMSLNDEKSNGFLKSNVEYYNLSGTLDRNEPIDQFKLGLNKGTVVNTNFTYTEPLSKALSLVVNYGLNVNNGTSDQQTLANSGNNNYNTFVDSLSNRFQLNQVSNQLGAIFNIAKGKTTFNFGLKAADVSFKQINEYTGDVFKRHFINWNPQAYYMFKFSQQRTVRVSYNGNTQQPSINQIQPVRNNNNPLYITLGNPNLQPSFRNNFNISYNSYKIISGEDLYLSGNYGFTTNAIVNHTRNDAGGKFYSEYFNLNGKAPANYRVYINYGRKIKGPDFNLGLNLSANGNESYTMVSTPTVKEQLNKTTSTAYSARLNINKFKQNKYDFYISGGPTFNLNRTSLQPDRNSDARGWNAMGWFGVYLPKGFEINSDIDYTYTGATKVLPQPFERFLWNAGLSKKFLKEKNLKFSVTVNDLLNQNTGFDRNAYDGRIVENRFTTIKRYFMFTVVYDFTKMGLIPKAN